MQPLGTKRYLEGVQFTNFIAAQLLISQYPFCKYHHLELVSLFRGFARLSNNYERIEVHCKRKISLL